MRQPLSLKVNLKERLDKKKKDSLFLHKAPVTRRFSLLLKTMEKRVLLGVSWNILEGFQFG